MEERRNCIAEDGGSSPSGSHLCFWFRDNPMSISPEDMAACLRVLQQVSEDPSLIQDNERMKGLVAKIHRGGKRGVRRDAQAGRRTEDRQLKERAAVVQARQGPGSLTALEDGALEAIGTLRTPARCYVCKQSYTEVHSFYHLLCPPCAAQNTHKRFQRADLTGRVALVTGGRIKIGFQMALRLLRDGARVIVTTRFALDAARRFAAEADSPDWQHRLRIEPLDLRHLPAVEDFTRRLLATEASLDILINNAAQTIKRPPAFYQHLRDAEPSRRQLEGAGEHVLTTGDFPLGSYDADGQQLDTRAVNSWRLRLEDVSAVEMLEVQLVNAAAPFILNARLKPLLGHSPFSRRFIVNVSAMEGQFARESKTVYHPHTNMAKAALNMMTRTAAAGYAEDGIYMNSVDTGWITDENPYPRRTHLQEERGFWTPLDCLDGMARIYDPIVRGLTEPGTPLFGHFLKDYAPHPW